LTKAKHLLNSLIDILFPPVCPACKLIVGKHGSLCVDCWNNIHFIEEPFCYKCGTPFAYKIGEKAICASCMQRKTPYLQARSLFKYDENSKSQILALKYHDKTALAPIFADWLTRIASELADKDPLIIPVPLHYYRFVARRYNQAALLAYALGKRTGLKVLPDTLIKKRKTPPQEGLSRKQREDNLRGAFAIGKNKSALLKGRSVILIDDVMTTGATIEACCRTLNDAGVRDIYILTIARTVLSE